MRFDYPGNVRELENAIEHAFVICGTNLIEAEDLPPHIIGEGISAVDSDSGSRTAQSSPLQGAEAAAIRDALERNHGNRSQTAKELGISRNTLWRKMKKYGIASTRSG
jgi:transcriptional regulator with PAS, ATPase and Fis domain